MDGWRCGVGVYGWASGACTAPSARPTTSRRKRWLSLVFLGVGGWVLGLNGSIKRRADPPHGIVTRKQPTPK